MSIENQYFNGIKFYKRADNDYWYSTVPIEGKRVYMHKYVWEFYNTKIPRGFEVHHIDLNRDNNDISNLRLMHKKEHQKLHNELNRNNPEWLESQRVRMKKASEKAVEWHKSEAGKEWHKEHAKKYNFGSLSYGMRNCIICGKEYEAKRKSQKFCSNACKSQYRRLNGLDNIKAVCPICGNEFIKNKYEKKQYCSVKCRVIARQQS